VSSLLQDSLTSFQARSKNREQRAHIIGRIFLIDAKTSTLEENPYNLALGTEYFVCFVEPLKLMGAKKSAASSAAASASSSASAAAGASAGTGVAGATSPAKAAVVSDVSVQESGADAGATAVTEAAEGEGSAKTLSLKNPSEQAAAGDRPLSGDKVR
jgi:hypothetical protein